jgi:anti-sigma regulatory factor (Ser/Thr protein kinase)
VTGHRQGGHAGRADPGFVHDALLYDTPGQLIDAAVPFLLDGLAAGDAAVLAAGPETTTLLRDALGNDPRILVLEQDAVYRSSTATAITEFRKLAAQRQPAPGRRVRVIGEVDFGDTAADRAEWQCYESIINHAYAASPLWGLCVYDCQRLPEQIFATARHTHPHLRTATGRRTKPEFVAPAKYLRSLPVPPEPLEANRPRLDAADVTDFIGLRHTVRAQLDTVDGPLDRIEDFLLAADEMTSNALRHGRPPVGLRLWIGPGWLVCTITDAGRGWDDPFAGYAPANGEDLSHGGMGLWLARQLCNHVAIRRESDGVSVRLTTHWS